MPKWEIIGSPQKHLLSLSFDINQQKPNADKFTKVKLNALAIRKSQRVTTPKKVALTP